MQLLVTQCRLASQTLQRTSHTEVSVSMKLQGTGEDDVLGIELTSHEVNGCKDLRITSAKLKSEKWALQGSTGLQDATMNMMRLITGALVKELQRRAALSRECCPRSPLRSCPWSGGGGRSCPARGQGPHLRPRWSVSRRPWLPASGAGAISIDKICLNSLWQYFGNQSL